MICLLSISAYAQQPSCCTSVNSCNNVLAMNTSFAAKHEVPVPFKLANPKGETISFRTNDGKEARGYYVRSENPTDKVVFVFHEWWGMNDYILEQADKIQTDLGDVNVLAIDLYDGHVATTTEDAQKYMSTMKEERSKAIIKGAIDYVGLNAKIATIGWCMGGAWSLQASILAGKQAVGCVMYYGMPEQDISKLKTLNCDVLGIFALQDKYISPEVVKTFEQNIKKAGKKLTIYNYDADHAFANPSNPKHNKEYTDDAYKKSLEFLKGHL
jgi:carboxymethylenebutenolidase